MPNLLLNQLTLIGKAAYTHPYGAHIQLSIRIDFLLAQVGCWLESN
jgi:hypothetical protein